MSSQPQALEEGSDGNVSNAFLVSVLRAELKKDCDQRAQAFNSTIEGLKMEIKNLRSSVSQCMEIINALTVSLTAGPSKKRAASALPKAQARSVEFFMTPDFQCLVYSVTIIGYMERICAERVDEDPLFCLRVLFFAPPPAERMAARKTSEGKVFEELRLKILKNSVYNCECSADQEFSPDDMDRYQAEGNEEGLRTANASRSQRQGSTTEEEPSTSFLRRPMWTRKNFIKPSYIASFTAEVYRKEAVVSSSETCTASVEGQCVRSPPAKRRRSNCTGSTSIDEAVSKEVLRMIWLKGTDWFNKARADCKKTFTKMLGLLFHDACQPEWRFEYPSSYALNVNTLPDAELSATLVSTSDINRRNRRCLQSVCDDHPLFSFRCEYGVEVFQSQQDCSSMSTYGEPRRLTRNISIMEVALQVCVSYFQCTDAEAYLRSSVFSMRFVFRLALAIAYGLGAACSKQAEGGSLESSIQLFLDLGLIIPSAHDRAAAVKEAALRITVTRYNEITGRSCGNGISGRGRSEDETEARTLSDDEDVNRVLPGL